MKTLVEKCELLIHAYRQGLLGQTIMPEDKHPSFAHNHTEERLCYFTLPMSLNYQRNSYTLWESALSTYEDPETRKAFDLGFVAAMDAEELRDALVKYKIALQPNKHIATWQKISKTIFENWGSLEKLFEFCGYDFLQLRDIVQKEYKKGFPYLSGPKIFNYWAWIIQVYGGIQLAHSELIDIAPDTHITKCSVVLGVISESEAESLSKEEISLRWRDLLKGSHINPIDMHAPLWFWSRNGFIFTLE